MSPDLWVPGVLVLAVGAAAGWWLARRKAASAASENSAAGGRDERAAADSLEVEDLRHRRDELYARLRAEDLEDEERTSLELEAASVLQQLDRLQLPGDAKARRQSKPDEAPEEGSDQPSTGGPPPSRVKTLLTGFAFGGATAALIALLVFWAGRDATPRPEMAGAGAGQADPRAGSEQPHPVGALAPEVQAEVDRILAGLKADPNDLEARKRLALLYLGSDQYVPAFEEAAVVLTALPDDIDSLYVQGVVRMTMGQDDAALAQLDRVLELFPGHVRAMTVKGLVFARQGRREEAASVWNRALEVGGPQPQIENLLAMLDSEQGMGGSPGAGSSNAAAGVSARDQYRVRVEADVIPGFPQTGTLFVALRTGESGPPVAVKRIEQPSFPLLVALGPDDLMMAQGGQLPGAGLLTVRLDQDGSVATRGEDDLEGSIEASVGDFVTLTLR